MSVSYYLDARNPVKSVVVLIPSIASETIVRAVKSVEMQNTKYDCQYLVVWDGPTKIPRYRFQNTMRLPWNVGGNGFYGHRIYASIPHLLNSDAVMFLDEDNTYENDHVETCMDKLNEGNDFVFSKRMIVDKEGHFVCYDQFESTGEEPIGLVDTSSYCFRRDWLINFTSLWHYGWGADRRFYQTVKGLGKHACTDKPTLIYTLDGNPNSPTKEFFLDGNLKHGWNEKGTEKQ